MNNGNIYIIKLSRFSLILYYWKHGCSQVKDFLTETITLKYNKRKHSHRKKAQFMWNDTDSVAFNVNRDWRWLTMDDSLMRYSWDYLMLMRIYIRIVPMLMKESHAWLTTVLIWVMMNSSSKSLVHIVFVLRWRYLLMV